MYNIPQGQITFENVHNFCEELHEENLILDYKSDWPSDLSRILCGMANVQGGMVIVGVGTKPGTRLPVWPPFGVEGTDDELNQKAVQIAYDAIYPPVFPFVDIVRLDTDPTRAIVVLRVDASRLLHATDQRRRVVVRVFDHTRGVQNDLANLSDLEWLFQQREKSIDLRHTVLERAATRASQPGTLDNASAVDTNSPLLTIFTVPVFPNTHATMLSVETRDLALGVGVGRSRRRLFSRTVPYITSWRTTAEGAFVQPNLQNEPAQYLEVGSHGLIFLQQAVPLRENMDTSSEQNVRLLLEVHVVGFCDAFLRFAAAFYGRAKWHGPLLVSASIRNIKNVMLDPRAPQALDPLNTLWYGGYAQDTEIRLYEGEHSAQVLTDTIDNVLTELASNLLWAFGYPYNRDDIKAIVDKLLAA